MEDMLDPIAITICSCFGLDPDSVESVDPEDFIYDIHLAGLDADKLISIIRSEVTDCNSVLNSLTITRRVFRSAKFSIFVGSSSTHAAVELIAPENHEWEDEDPIPMTTKLSLPPNSTHSPVRVVFVDGSSQQNIEKSDLDRSVLIQVPAEIVEDDETAFASPATTVVARIDGLLARSIPILPESFTQLKRLLVN